MTISIKLDILITH